jgi:hypothetical protein
MQRLRKINSPGARANAIIEIYGDITSDENEDIRKTLKKNKVINDATLRYLKKKSE